MAANRGLVIMSSSTLAALGLKTLLVGHEPYLELMATTVGEQATAEALSRYQPGLLAALDPTPSQVGRFMELAPQTEMMVVLSGPDAMAHRGKEMMGLGVKAVVGDDEPPSSFQAGAMAAIDGNQHISSGLAVEMARHSNILSEREAQVAALTAGGYSGRQIADKLYLSTRTVESHRAGAYKKLGFRERWQLVRYAAEHGMLTPEVWDGETDLSAGGDGPAAV